VCQDSHSCVCVCLSLSLSCVFVCVLSGVYVYTEDRLMRLVSASLISLLMPPSYSCVTPSDERVCAYILCACIEKHGWQCVCVLYDILVCVCVCARARCARARLSRSISSPQTWFLWQRLWHVEVMTIASKDTYDAKMVGESIFFLSNQIPARGDRRPVHSNTLHARHWKTHLPLGGRGCHKWGFDAKGDVQLLCAFLPDPVFSRLP